MSGPIGVHAIRALIYLLGEIEAVRSRLDLASQVPGISLEADELSLRFLTKQAIDRADCVGPDLPWINMSLLWAAREALEVAPAPSIETARYLGSLVRELRESADRGKLFEEAAAPAGEGSETDGEEPTELDTIGKPQVAAIDASSSRNEAALDHDPTRYPLKMASRPEKRDSRRKLKEPTEREWMAWRVRKLVAKNQTDAAMMMERETGEKWDQSKISRAMNKVDTWIRAGNTPPPFPKPTIHRSEIPVDPADIERDRRLDGRPGGKGEPNDEDDD